jgi:hypothetical protein
MDRCQAFGMDKVGCQTLWTDAMGLSPDKQLRGIPLRPDPAALYEAETRSWHRAITAAAFSIRDNRDPASILRSVWPHDRAAAAIVARAPVSPTGTGNYPTFDPISVFRSIAPGSAAAALFAMSPNKFDLAGRTTIRVPLVNSLPAAPVFVGEGLPAPVVQFSFASAVVGPARKILLLSAVSAELESAGPEAASTVIARVLADATNKSIDTVAFDTVAGDTVRPPGLLHAVTPIVPTAGGGPAGMAADLVALVNAVALAGIDATDVVFVAGAREATLIKLNAGFRFNYQVLQTLGLPAKSIACFAPAALFVGYDGTPEIETSREAVFHFEGASPTDISSVGSPNTVAAPAKSLFQNDLIGIRVRANAAWSVAPGGAQIILNVTW